MLEPPSMTPQEIEDYPLFAPPARVSCYQHSCTLWVGTELPGGGAEAVAKAAGCPAWKFGAPPENFADCPVPAEIDRLNAERTSNAIEVIPAPAPPLPMGTTATGMLAAAPPRDEPGRP